jgi:hypothetical protein
MTKAGTILIGEHANDYDKLYVVLVHGKVHSIWNNMDKALDAKQNYLNNEENPWITLYEVPINTTPTNRDNSWPGDLPFRNWTEVLEEEEIQTRQEAMIMGGHIDSEALRSYCEELRNRHP